MVNEHVIHALTRKRAALSGELIQAEALAQRLQSEIAAVDTTLRLFDPDQRPATIRPVVKRTKPARFRTGEFTRILLGIIREAPGPMTVRDLAAAVAAAHGLDTSSKAAMKTLVANTRAALSKAREGVVRETVDGVYQWRRADG